MSKYAGGNTMFNGLGMDLGNLSRLSNAKSRSISPENRDGSAGAGGMATEGTGAECARELGKGWKVSPSIEILPGETTTLADIEGPGAIQQIWMTAAGNASLRNLILRITWEDQEHPSVEVPLGDFFASGWGRYAQVSSLPVCANPARGYNCFWEMPFRKRAQITLENRDEKLIIVYYQINYALTEVPEDCAYFHAQFRRSNPVPYMKEHTVLDGVSGQGHYVGTYMAWGVNNNGWWGEGEVKFFLDDDDEYPTICGTGTEDYFCGSHNFDPRICEPKDENRYVTFTAPYCGLPQVIQSDGMYDSSQRFGMYRWHITDPIRFQEKISVTIQCLGWRTDFGTDFRNKRYLPRRDDIASTAIWYQTLPSRPLSPLGTRDDLEII